MRLPTPSDQAPGELEPGLDGALGTQIISATAEEVVLTLSIGPHHLQPYGVVHGGVWASLAETAASVGASLSSGSQVVGLDNHTSFLRAISDGAVRVVARPIHPGRSTQVWEVVITEMDGSTSSKTRPVAQSLVRLYVIGNRSTT